MLLLWISAAVLAPADLSQNVLSESQTSETRENLMKIAVFYYIYKRLEMKLSWSMPVLEGKKLKN